jgi:hypothetical protein
LDDPQFTVLFEIEKNLKFLADESKSTAILQSTIFLEDAINFRSIDR